MSLIEKPLFVSPCPTEMRTARQEVAALLAMAIRRGQVPHPCENTKELSDVDLAFCHPGSVHDQPSDRKGA